MRHSLACLLLAAVLGGCAAPEREDPQQVRAAECRWQQSLPAPGHNLLTGNNASCQPVAGAHSREAAPEPRTSAARSSMVREGPTRSVSLSTLQASGKVFHPPVQPALMPVQGEGSGASGQPALLPALFVPVDSQPHSGFAIGGRLITSPEPGATDDVEGAELQFRFMH